MYLKPCRNCPHRSGCTIKLDMLKSLRGLGISSANFKCDKRLSMIPPGQRIEIDLVHPGHYEDKTVCHAGTVMAVHGVRLLVWLDEVSDMGHNPISVQPDRLRPIEGRVEVCPDCGQPEGTEPLPDREGHQRFICPTCDGHESPWDR